MSIHQLPSSKIHSTNHGSCAINFMAHLHGSQEPIDWTPQGSNIVGKVWNDTRGSFMGQNDIRAIPVAGMLHSHELQVLCCDCMFRERQGGCGKTGTLPRPFPLPSMLHVHVENHLRPPTGHDNKLLFYDIASWWHWEYHLRFPTHVPCSRMQQTIRSICNDCFLGVPHRVPFETPMIHAIVSYNTLFQLC